MAEAFMAYPELRHPFEASPIHPQGSTTVLYHGNATVLSETGTSDGLLIDPADLTQITGFELKPEGACFEDLCVPIGSDILVKQAGRQWFDLGAFADKLEQPYVADKETDVWSFAEPPAKRASMMVDAMAPDFTVNDRQGNPVRMADLKGKKALIVTWSSW